MKDPFLSQPEVLFHLSLDSQFRSLSLIVEKFSWLTIVSQFPVSKGVQCFELL